MDTKTNRRKVSAELVASFLSKEEMRKIEGDPRDLYQQGEDYYYGRNGRGADEERAFKLYAKAAQLGYADAQFKVQSIWGITIRPASIPNLNPQELYQKGNDYYYGWNGCSKDEDKAYDFYVRAANAGHAGAKNQLKNIWGTIR